MSTSSWIGKSLNGRYKIEELLGQGGMSAVYKATDPNLKRVVAIKMIHSHLSDDPDFVRRFEEEASSVAQLRHPSIIQVYDFNHDDESDSYYMVLEFVPGETFQQHLARLNAAGRKVSSLNAAEYLIDICEAVGYAHQRGMIHRDIKPANLMLNVTGQAILMDFGIAKIVGGQRHTATGAVVGTAMYMSPEQIKGESPDHRSDIYSLGVTLFEMLSGRPPFEADSAMTLMMMHVNDPVPDLKSLNPEVPDDLVAVIEKALAKDPNDRYQTAAQMAAALRNVVTRIKSGASLEETIPPAATMVETPDLTPKGAGETLVEEPVPFPDSPEATYVEPVSTPMESSQGTQVKSTTPPPPTSDVGTTTGGGIPADGPRTGPVSKPRTPPPTGQTKILGMSLPVFAGGVIVLLCLLGSGIFFASRLSNGTGGASTATVEPVIPVVNTQAPTKTSTPEATATSPEPTLTPTETPIPPTPTPDTPYVVITDITLDGTTYVVDYEVHNFPESPQLHVHMFFNTVPPEQAGAPGKGPWKLTWGPYGDPPFTQYGVANRPPNATQMCSLVANPNHSVQFGTGNCVDLPEN